MMKKLTCLLLAALLMLSAACAETEDVRKVLNPNEYSMIEVCDYWFDYDEHTVQGSFGDYVIETEELDGFDPEEICALTLAPDALIMLPNEAGEIVPATTDDLDAYVDAIRQTNEPISFYCEFEMNEEGVLTKLVYCVPGEYEVNDSILSPEYYNPNNYTLMRVEDAYQCDDEDYVVCASFGECDYSDESNPVWQGFDEEGMLISVAPDAEIEMSPNLDDEDNVPMSTVEFVELVSDKLDAYDGKYSFYCTFEMNEEGVLTKLVYDYMPY